MYEDIVGSLLVHTITMYIFLLTIFIIVCAIVLSFKRYFINVGLVLDDGLYDADWDVPMDELDKAGEKDNGD